MQLQVLSLILLVSVVVPDALPLPYSRNMKPNYAPRGNLKPSLVSRGTRPSVNEVLNAYLEAAQHQQLRREPHYGYATEYMPAPSQGRYQAQGYIGQRPRRIQGTNLAPLIQYMNSPEFLRDYPYYDLPAEDDQTFTDNEGTWYDNRIDYYDLPSDRNDFMVDDQPSDQDVALAKLMLDHMAGKYSLEDLETLQREAKIEENTEKQLKTLAKQQTTQKRSNRAPLIGLAAPRSVSRNYGSGFSRGSNPRGLSIGIAPVKAGPLVGFTSRDRGQKEEPLMIPATNGRRPVFVQELNEGQKRSSKPVGPSIVPKVTPKSAPVPTPETLKAASKSIKPVAAASSVVAEKRTTPKGRESGVVEVVKVDSNKMPLPIEVKSSSDDTSSPYLRPAYEALKQYLDAERKARVKADEEILKVPQKRFVRQESDTLRDQLNNLKKSVA